jgi:hypothetical protein
VKASKRTLGEEHSDTLVSIRNLAVIYRVQGKLQDAADLQERTLEASKRTLGEVHPVTLANIITKN